MGWGNPDVHYQPEAFDLEVLGSIDMHEPDYDFDIVAAWRHTVTGQVYWARDSGCSCPSPFEEFTSLDKLEKLVSANFSDLERETEGCYDQAARRDFLRKVKKALPG